jgi:hypothetical protein
LAVSAELADDLSRGGEELLVGIPAYIVNDVVEHFDHHAPEFAKERVPQRVDARMSQHCPATCSDAEGSSWITSKYKDIVRGAHDVETFPSALGNGVPHAPVPV